MVSDAMKKSTQPILKDKICPVCKHNESKIHGHPEIHLNRVCMRCGKVYL